MRIVKETVAKLGIAGELIVFLWKRKLWWLIPMVRRAPGVRHRDRRGRFDGRWAVRVHAVLGAACYQDHVPPTPPDTALRRYDDD